jgi:branched-chain amino acid transport system permease protein
MSIEDQALPAQPKAKAPLISRIRAAFSRVPMLGWLLGAMAAVLIERIFGYFLARLLGLSNVPTIFGVTIIFSNPALIPSALIYTILVYVLPISLLALLTVPLTNRVAAWLLRLPMWLTGIFYVALLYVDLAIWAGISDYRVLLARLIMIAIITTLSLNVVNGYMGEFSCSHPGFMALGAYGASVITVLLFSPNNVFGITLLPASLAPLFFPLALIAGGLLAAFGALFVAIPSFRTRGDYLAIISLAFTFIVKSLIENLEIVGGARGFMGQPNVASLLVVFIWTVASILIINNFVRSTLGKALNAVRDDETAADAMTVNTRHTKMVAFLFSAFWAGVAGGLLAHVLRYVNPGSFGVLKLSEVLAMVYLGGLNSVVGSLVGAIGLNFLMEALRPLEILKWIVIPVLLILVMIFRPTGLIAFREFKVENLIRPRDKSKVVPTEEVEHAVVGD